MFWAKEKRKLNIHLLWFSSLSGIINHSVFLYISGGVTPRHPEALGHDLWCHQIERRSDRLRDLFWKIKSGGTGKNENYFVKQKNGVKIQSKQIRLAWRPLFYFPSSGCFTSKEVRQRQWHHPPHEKQESLHYVEPSITVCLNIQGLTQTKQNLLGNYDCRLAS